MGIVPESEIPRNVYSTQGHASMTHFDIQVCFINLLDSQVVKLTSKLNHHIGEIIYMFIVLDFSLERQYLTSTT